MAADFDFRVGHVSGHVAVDPGEAGAFHKRLSDFLANDPAVLVIELTEPWFTDGGA